MEAEHASGYRALLWQSLFDDYAGALGNYDIIFSLFRARQHFYFLSIMTRISELPCLAFRPCRRRRLVMRI